jgi:hypothetical protein
VKSLRQLILILLALWLLGPLVIIAAILSGANLFDGLFGVYENHAWQNALLMGGFVLTTIGWIVALILSIFALFTMWSRSNRIVLGVLVIVNLPLLVILASEYL